MQRFACAVLVGLLQLAKAEGPFELPALPYEYDALEPHIDAQTMRIHHGKHHATYVAGLNAALAAKGGAPAKGDASLLTQLQKEAAKTSPAMRNHGGGHYNHALFWAFSKAALGRFGSGWAWLGVGIDGALRVTSTANQVGTQGEDELRR
eukprot:Skav217498  [mRNA]  locus=scaffold1908:126387:134942:- [translate_table: standard]